ncbi:hypothetical protein [Haloarcula amylovorans]|uniref:hypothetical protein n=1 Tax=Haloarcula amylovorans TaxID=2562280 RepID=UPI001076120B|nr:hypothetical protein [Halomicroarcula amylolytica]
MMDEKAGTRRRFLAALSTTPLLAGCLGSNQNGATNDRQSSTTENQDTADQSPETPLAHIAAKGVADEPTLGPDIGEGEATIIAFEDPSCHACQSFERAYNSIPLYI